MLPSTPFDTGSRAELRVFDLLREIRPDDPQDEFLGFHSLSLGNHPRQRFGEIDFLLCGRLGIYVLEVKGGTVACEQGKWRFGGQGREEHRGPFRQAEEALHAVRSHLERELGSEDLATFAIGFGVIFPDVEWKQPGLEWDARTLADARAMPWFDRWLDELVRHWRSRHPPRWRDILPTSEQVARVRQLIRPDFETIPLLGVDGEERARRLTEDQFVLLDVVEANPRTLCQGGAGTGKTFLAAELARRWSAAGKSVLFACASPWLRAWLECQLPSPGICVATCDALEVEARRFGADRFDALIVDEAQDLMQVGSLDKLDRYVKAGLRDGAWCFFGDFQNQSGLVADVEAVARTWIEDCKPVRVPLRTNCRNTLPILQAIQQRLGADMGVRGTGEGPSVREIHTRDGDEAGQRLASVLDAWLHAGLPFGRITILSPVDWRQSCARRLPERLRCHIQPLDLHGIRRFPPTQHISFARIADFKGLENDAIVVVDLKSPDHPSERAAAYVGMSRARAQLVVVYL